MDKANLRQGIDFPRCLDSEFKECGSQKMGSVDKVPYCIALLGACTKQDFGYYYNSHHLLFEDARHAEMRGIIPRYTKEMMQADIKSGMTPLECTEKDLIYALYGDAHQGKRWHSVCCDIYHCCFTCNENDTHSIYFDEHACEKCESSGQCPFWGDDKWHELMTDYGVMNGCNEDSAAYRRDTAHEMLKIIQIKLNEERPNEEAISRKEEEQLSGIEGDVMQEGWVCPICKSVLSPFTSMCPNCYKQPPTETASSEDIKWDMGNRCSNCVNAWACMPYYNPTVCGRFEERNK